ncbi:hypothetical protein DVK01_13515 [Haloarcula sp. Atlit-120R]|nr:hypothetical protein DVK01_13515 [Haloarcula sp. Atlit-120R]
MPELFSCRTAQPFLTAERKGDIETIEAEFLGVQVTLAGLFLVILFDGVFPYPTVGLLFGALGTTVFLMRCFQIRGPDSYVPVLSNQAR